MSNNDLVKKAMKFNSREEAMAYIAASGLEQTEYKLRLSNNRGWFLRVNKTDLNRIAIKRWRGKRGAAGLKKAMRTALKFSPTVKRFGLGNVWSVNSYGAH